MTEEFLKKPQVTAGLVAHVDAGKTTLSESLLYCGGLLKKTGRVDHKDAFLDTDALERARGITIFAKQAVLPLSSMTLTLLDTPGHVDFSGEMERTLQVLDCAILVISGTDGVQGHTMTVWKLLEKYKIPTFLFVNKMDLAGAEKEKILTQLQKKLSPLCADFTGAPEDPALQELAALQDETLMEEYLETGTVKKERLAELVSCRRLFPCWFGSALLGKGVEEFLAGLGTYLLPPGYPGTFGAKVYKIMRDEAGNRLTCLKVTGGSLQVKTALSGCDRQGQNPWQEKIHEIRLYSGAKYKTADEVPAGSICAVTGLSFTWLGEGLGCEQDSEPPLLQPVLSCEVILPEGCDAHTALQKLSLLQEEDPQLQVIWDERFGRIRLQMMGEVQLDVLKALIARRFGLQVDFEKGHIVYKETIAAPALGIGHFEPLRHYAEVQLLLEPLPAGSGLVFESRCSEDVLDKNWQRLIYTHLTEKQHLGVLTASPVTDMRITLLAGRVHPKHTEGGDFREATCRAVRQGLMEAESILLEPWYDFRLEVPAGQIGRAISDVQKMGGSFDEPETAGETALLSGSTPVCGMQDYALQVAAYTKGRGRLSCTLGGYRPCKEQAAVVKEIGYEPERDTENPADSVFCAHGAGFGVPWQQVPLYAHLDTGFLKKTPPPVENRPGKSRPARTAQDEEKELASIFERTYGVQKRRELFRTPPAEAAVYTFTPPPEEYLLVDGYNIIFAWDDLRELAKTTLDGARQALADILCNYQGYRRCRVILVFDAYRVKNNPGEVFPYHNITVVYTREAETADMYIEKTTYQLPKNRRVRVASSDGLEQLIILGHGALRVSARMFRLEVEEANTEIRAILEKNNEENDRHL